MTRPIIPTGAAALAEVLQRAWTQWNADFLSRSHGWSREDLSSWSAEVEQRQGTTLSALFSACRDGQLELFFHEIGVGECRVPLSVLSDHNPLTASSSSLWNIHIDEPYEDSLSPYNGACFYVREDAGNAWLCGQAPLALVGASPAQWLIAAWARDRPQRRKEIYIAELMKEFTMNKSQADLAWRTAVLDAPAAIKPRPGRPKKK